MEISIQKIYGNIGEEVCRNYLSENMEEYTRSDSINFIGSSLLSSDFNSKFDVSDIKNITKFCQKSGYCDFSKNEMPCQNKTFFNENYSAINLLNHKDTGDKKYRWYCSIRNTKIELQNYNQKKHTGADKFIRDYMLCHYFIQNNYYEKLISKPYGKLTDQERKVHKKYWNGHPGRLDFFSYLNNKFYCIDAKVNTSRLSLWQQVRMAWMQKQGHISQIFNVKFNCKNKESLISIYINEGISSAISSLEIEKTIIDYDPSRYPEAEEIISDQEKVVETAQSKFVWF